MKCNFRTVHPGIYSYQKINFECEEQALANKPYCMFHDESYYKDNEDQMKSILIKKIKDHIFNNKDLFCIGYNIPNITIKETFNIQICFNQSKFHSNLKIESIFYNNVSFQECQFEGDVSASNCIFYNFVNLSSSTFHKILGLEKTEFDTIQCKDSEFNDAYFPDAKFFSYAIFQQSKLKNLHLSNAQFIDNVHFYSCEISGFVNLSCSFYKEIIFSFTKFIPEKGFGVYFGKANFYGKSQFIKNDFSNVCYLHEVNFYDKVIFEQCNFYDVNFNKSIFHKDASFNNCKFINNFYFEETIFQNVDFKKSTFNSGNFTSADFQIFVDFSEVEFNDVYFIETNFNKSSFKNALFNKAIFKSSQFLDQTDFHFVNFKDPTSFIFDSINLSNISFLNSDITRIGFNNIQWSSSEYKYKIFEERILEERLCNNNSIDLNFSLEDILSIYRNLRENYEYKLRYDEAGEFFIREMELKRNYRKENDNIMKNCRFRRNISYSGIYHNISKYGESISRPIILLVSLIIGSTLIWYFYLFFTNIKQNEEIPFIFYNSTLSIQALKITFSNIFQVNEHSAIIDYFIRILSIFLLGVLFIALRRRFERRFRH